jgi:hypothetical protein
MVELRLVIAYAILAVLVVATAVGLALFQRRRAARRLRMRGIKLDQRR